MCCLLIGQKSYDSVSVVYNLRIAETTKHYRLDSHYIYPILIADTPLGQLRHKRDGTRQSVAANLSNFIYSAKTFYVRADFAVARITQDKQGVHFAQTQTDDLLFSAGYTHSLQEGMIVTLSGLLGIPTHRDLSLENFQFGYGHVGLGIQADGAFEYLQNRNQKHSMRTAARVIHFFPRKTPFKNDDQVHQYDFDFGNLADLFIAHHTTWGDHRFEAGYNPTFLWGTKISPRIANVVKNIPYIRSTFYGTYKYCFSLYDLPNSIALGFSEGFDHKPQKEGYKNITAFWVTWDLNF